jgi:hypothetical protein
VTVLKSAEPVPTSLTGTSARVNCAMGATTMPIPAAPMTIPGSMSFHPVSGVAAAAVRAISVNPAAVRTRPIWTGDNHVVQNDLARLSDDQLRALLEPTTGGQRGAPGLHHGTHLGRRTDREGTRRPGRPVRRRRPPRHRPRSTAGHRAGPGARPGDPDHDVQLHQPQGPVPAPARDLLRTRPPPRRTTPPRDRPAWAHRFRHTPRHRPHPARPRRPRDLLRTHQGALTPAAAARQPRNHPEAIFTRQGVNG